MTKEITSNNVNGVPKQVNDEFIKALEKEQITPEVINQLKKILSEEGKFTESSLTRALFGNPNDEV